MKLLRYGTKGQEKPGLLDEEGRIRSLSDKINDIDGAFLASDRLATSPPVMRLLRDMQLETKFLDIGFRCAETLVELLRGLPPGHAAGCLQVISREVDVRGSWASVL